MISFHGKQGIRIRFEAKTSQDKMNVTGGLHVYYYKEDLINMIVPDQPDPQAARVLQEALGVAGVNDSLFRTTIQVSGVSQI